MTEPDRVQEADPVPGVMSGWSRRLLSAREPWRLHREPSDQGLGGWPPVSLFSPPFIFVYRDLSFEMTLCVSLSAGLSLELPVPQQEPMELGHRAGRTGKQGHAECMCRASGGTPLRTAGTNPAPSQSCFGPWTCCVAPTSLRLLSEDRRKRKGAENC